MWQPFRLATPLHPKLVYKSPVVCTSLSHCQSSNTVHLIPILPPSNSISFPADPGHNTLTCKCVDNVQVLSTEYSSLDIHVTFSMWPPSWSLQTFRNFNDHNT